MPEFNLAMMILQVICEVRLQDPAPKVGGVAGEFRALVEESESER
jgi:hypothetical protein